MKQYKIDNKVVKANNVVDAVKKFKDTYYQQSEIYRLCVRNQYYTRGTNAEYDKMLTAVYENKWSPEQIAQDINEHSVANWGQYDKILREVKSIMSVKDSVKDSSFEDYLEHMYSYGVKYREVPNDRASGIAYEIKYKDYATGQELKLKAHQYGKHLISHEPGRLVVGDSVKDDDYSYEVIKEQISNENFGKELLLKKAYNGLTRGSMTKEQYEKLVQEIKSLRDSKCKDYYDIHPGAIFKSTSAYRMGGQSVNVYIKVMNVKDGMVVYNYIINRDNKYITQHDPDKSIEEFKKYLSIHGFRPVNTLYDSKDAKYQFPELNERDLDELKKYNLKVVKNIGEDVLVEGSLADLKRYAKNYLAYELHPDYIQDEDIESLSKEEEQAIEDYKRAIAETKDPKLLRLFAHILKEEIEHLEELQSEEIVDTCKRK